MARAKKKRKISAHQRSFGRAAKAANVICHKETASVGAYKKCMSTEMKSRLGGGKKKKAAASKSCAGLVKSGPRKGRLKKGYTRSGVAKGRCPVKKK